MGLPTGQNGESPEDYRTPVFNREAPNLREAIREALALLSKRDRRLLWVSISMQMMTSILDLVGIILLGLTAAMAVTVLQSQPPPPMVIEALRALGQEDVSPESLVLIIGAIAACALLAKSGISSYLLRRVLRFLANRQALISARLLGELMSKPLTEISQRSSQTTSYALMGGAGAATIGLLGSLALLATEASVLILLGTALMFVNPLVTLGAVAFFAVVAFSIQRPLGMWGSRLGSAGASLDIQSLNSIQEALAAYREISVLHRRDLYVARIQELRWSAARIAADGAFIGQIPKYILEVALVVGGVALAGVLFLTQDAVTAVGTLALYLTATSRIMPSLLRLQGASLVLRGSAGAAQPTFELAEWLQHPTDDPGAATGIDVLLRLSRQGHGDFSPSVLIEHVSFYYPGALKPALADVSLEVQAGTSAALVGRSGAGKSTLADVILGVLEPQAGRATVAGCRPAAAVEKWPGAVAYVPQEIVLANATVRSNVALGYPNEAIDDDLAWEALDKVHLGEILRRQRDGLDTQIGEGGLKLSGGQRQRLGLARALYTRPRLIVLDEATSALDAETEQDITEAITSLASDVTLVIVAHRLSTVKAADQVVYLHEGQVMATGSFEEVREQVPAFARQAHLLGL